MNERWCYELTMPTGTAVTYDIMRATNAVGATVEGNAADDPYGDEGWPDCEFIASVWAEKDPEGRARLIASAPDLLETLKDIANQKLTTELEEQGDIEFGYDTIIKVARDAVAKAEAPHDAGPRPASASDE